MKSPHLTALGWIAVLAFATSLVLGLISSTITISSYSTSGELAMKVGLAELSNFAFLTGTVAGLLAIALAGVRHLLTQLPDMAAKLATDAEAARAASAARLAEYRAKQQAPAEQSGSEPQGS